MLPILLAVAPGSVLTGNRIALAKGTVPAHPLLLTQTIANLAKGKKNGLSCTDAEAAEIDEVVSMLEAQNPTPNPAESPLLDGTWRLLYTSTKGGSAGKLGPFVGTVKQVITFGEDYYNEVALRGVRAVLAAHWEVLSPTSWSVIFDTLTIRVLGRRVVEKPFPPGQTGIWRMTYLSEDLRILRASGSNSPDVENVYVLQKQP